MDIGTTLGLFFGITVVSLAIATGSNFSIFLNLPGFLIVVGGTFAAIMIKFPLSGVFVSLPVGLKAAFMNDKERSVDYITLAVKLVKRGRKSGLISLEKEKISNPFYRKGIQLCADGRDNDYIRKILTQEMNLAIQREEVGARVFASIGEASPAFGMFGTLVGLVQMLSNLSDPTTIGPAMAVAMLTTLYGVLIANLIALPIADKLENKSAREKTQRGLIIECILQVQQLQNPTALREILEPYLPEKQRESANTGTKPGKTD
jgi:chemotaxis protein MotA